MKLPVLIEKDEDGFYVVECPVLRGCYSQGRSLEEALERLKEVIHLCLEEEDNKEIIENYNPLELDFHILANA